MAGMIRREDIDTVRAAVRIDDLVSEYVALKPAGAGSLVGLCPFHDEKTPSFNVRPHVGRYHCFGCGVDGDVFTFLQELEHVSFVEAVEFLAHKHGIELHYEGGRTERRTDGPKRARLVDAHRVAVDYYRNQLTSDEAEPARRFLLERGFGEDVWETYSLGYAPKGWDGLLSHLRHKGFTDSEIIAAGLVTAGQRSPYDRFRGRLMWPIFSTTSEPIAFGARKIFDDDQGPKYLNTAETSLYKKNQVLYGLNMAKKAIVADKRVVIVEGYTDVMAAHLAGVPHAVATCGTAFGVEHIRIVRRLLGDGANAGAGLVLASGVTLGGEVIFTFDGDKAGKEAALRAFKEDQRFATQTYVVVSPNNMDPCEVRLNYGDEAVVELINNREPLFAFVIRTILSSFDLKTAEGRAYALERSAPIVHAIKDPVLRGEYTRQLATWVGMPDNVVRECVQRSRPSFEGIDDGAAPLRTNVPEETASEPALHLTPRARLSHDHFIERSALEVAFQLPMYAHHTDFDALPEQIFALPEHAAVFHALRDAGGVNAYMARYNELVEAGTDDAATVAHTWFIAHVAQTVPHVSSAVGQLAVENLPEHRPEKLWDYVRGVMLALYRLGYDRQIAEARRELQMTDASTPAHEALFKRLIELETARRSFDEINT